MDDFDIYIDLEDDNGCIEIPVREVSREQVVDALLALADAIQDGANRVGYCAGGLYYLS